MLYLHHFFHALGRCDAECSEEKTVTCYNTLTQNLLKGLPNYADMCRYVLNSLICVIICRFCESSCVSWPCILLCYILYIDKHDKFVLSHAL